MTRVKEADAAHVLADAMREAHLDLILVDNPHGIVPGNVPLAGLGRHDGYLRLARSLTARGVHAPDREEFVRNCEYIADLRTQIKELKEKLEEVKP